MVNRAQFLKQQREQMTKQDFDLLVKYKLQAGYTQPEINDLTALYRRYVNPMYNPGCSSCGAAEWLSELKKGLYGWFNNYKLELEVRFEQEEQAIKQMKQQDLTDNNIKEDNA